MISLLVRWVVNALALLVVCYFVPGIIADSIVVIFIAAAALGLLNAVVRPVLYFLTFPLTVVTLGLFLIVLNAIMLELTALLIPGFRIESFLSAIIGAIILGLISLVTSRIGKKKEKD